MAEARSRKRFMILLSWLAPATLGGEPFRRLTRVLKLP
jgi:hypothetical protein